MKRRQGFVSNSSSASFVLDVKGLGEDILEKIRDHIRCAMEAKFIDSEDESWEIRENGDKWFCITSMDNFPLDDWITKGLGVSADRISEQREGHW